MEDPDSFEMLNQIRGEPGKPLVVVTIQEQLCH